VALSDEQNAMLRLLAQGEQSYGDIAALMGLGEDEVRAKVVGALAQLEAEGKPAPDVPPPIAGGARPAAEVTPPEPEPVAEEPEEGDEDDAEPAVAEAIAPQEPVEPAKPKAKPAKKSGPAKPKPSAAPKPTVAASAPAGGRGSGGSSSGQRTITLPTGRGAWLLGGGIVAAIAVIVVVILLVSGGGDGGSSSTATEGTTANANSETGTEPGTGSETGKAAGEGGTKELTQAQLTAVDGSEAKGVATFGRVKNKLALQIEATELEPTIAGTNSYTIWLAQSPKKMLPLASTTVKASGKGANEIAAQFEVPVEVLAYLANGTFDQLEITRTEDEKFKATIETATKAKTTPTYFGEPVLRGTIIGPIIGLAKREEEEQKGE
jgi:hypothetical protein